MGSNAAITHLLIACVPVFMLLFYFWHRDVGEKEPMDLMRKVFFYGLLITIPVGIVEGYIDNIFFDLVGTVNGAPPWWYWFIMPFFFVALPEEFSKLYVVKKIAYDHSKFNELMDGITYCVLASMGFALLENIMYIWNYGDGVGLVRAFTAVPAHALFSGLMGFYVGRAKFAKKKEVADLLMRKGLLVGVFFHGLYDFLLMSGYTKLMWLIIPLLIYMAIVLHHGIKKATAEKHEELRFI